MLQQMGAVQVVLKDTRGQELAKDLDDLSRGAAHEMLDAVLDGRLEEVTVCCPGVNAGQVRTVLNIFGEV